MSKSESKQKLLAKKTSSISGVISVSGDKSISHRAIILSKISQKTVKIYNILDSTDT